PRQEVEMELMKMRQVVEEMAVAARAAGNDKMMIDAKMAMADVESKSGGQPPASYAPVYFPGTTQASGASSVVLSLGEERAGVDMQLQMVPTGQIAGGIVA